MPVHPLFLLMVVVVPIVLICLAFAVAWAVRRGWESGNPKR